jgi:membrane protein required for colicin V production
MNNLDVIILIILILSTLIGFVRGFITSFLSIVGWVAAVILNHYTFPHIEPFLATKFKTKVFIFITGYVGGLLILLLLFSILNFIITTIIGKIKGHYFDKVFGSIFGFIRGVFLPVAIFLCFEIGFTSLRGEEVKNENMPSFLLNAKSLPFLKEGEGILLDILPDTFTMKLYSYMHMIKSDNVERKNLGIDDITILNIIRKLSTYAPLAVLDKIDTAASQDSKYMSKRQLRVEKIRKLWQNYEDVQHQNNMFVERLSQNDIDLIKQILNS